MIISLFFIPEFRLDVDENDNLFTVYLGSEMMGTLDSAESINECLLAARKEVNSKSEDLTFLDIDTRIESSRVNFGRIDSEAVVISNMAEYMSANRITSLTKAYEVKINSYTTILQSAEDVQLLFQAVADKYDEEDKYQAMLNLDDTRELPVLVPVLNSTEEVEAIEEAEETATFSSGFDADMSIFFNGIEADVNDLDDYETGLVSMSFKDSIEITEVYVNPSQISTVTEAISELTGEVEEDEVYKVQSGDTLSGIAMKLDIPMENLVAMNDNLDDVNSLIRPNDELVVTVSKPKLTVVRKEVMHYEENYSEEPIITYNPDWYTTESVVHVQPSDGHREVVAEVTFENDEKVSSDVIDQVVSLKAVAKEVEKGSKIPPTYIKPINGGRVTSGFGPRKAPKKGASTYHKGIDWGVAKGTPVYASCGGTVIKAGWGSGYGYVVYLQHPDGRQTRYAHLSKVLVSAGQSVSQGQKIALSGNTGNSTGPHLHFEMLIGGKQVNPLAYLN